MSRKMRRDVRFIQVVAERVGSVGMVDMARWRRESRAPIVAVLVGLEEMSVELEE